MRHPEADQEPGASAAGQVHDQATPGAAKATEAIITLIGLEHGGGQPETDQAPTASDPGEAAPTEPVPPAMAAKALIASPSITAGADGDSPAPDLSKDFDALDLALDQAWDQHCAPICVELPDERRRHFVARKLGYVVVAADDVAEPGPKGDDADP